VIFSRLLFLAAVGLLVAGGVYVGNYKQPNSVSLGIKLVRAGYIVVVVLLTYLIGFQVYLWIQRGQLSHCSATVSVRCEGVLYEEVIC
jgi:hypothetical protein